MRAPASSTTLVGRGSDLAALRDEFAAASRGELRAVVIGGEAGIGKSRLLDEFLSEQEHAATVLLGRCVDLGDDGAPYAPFAAVLRRLIQTVGLERVLEAAGPGAGVLSALLPELADDSAVPPRTGAERLYELVTVLLERVSAERPVILAIEDLHWADRSTLELLRFIVRMAESGRLLVLLTYRSDEVPRGHVLRSWLPELERTRRVTRWELSRLGDDQVAELVEELLGRVPDDGSLERVTELSEGVPFFVEELVGIDGLRSGDDLPETLRELVLARYERLSEPAQRLLRVLAAGGVCVTHELLAAVFDGTPDELDAAAREAVTANLLAADSTEYLFRHALVREAIHADLLPGERTRYHARYAEALEVSPQRSAVQLSAHWLAAHDVRRAFLASLEAMEEAKRSYAYATVAAMGDRVLELWDGVPDAEVLSGSDRVAVLAQTASALRNAGNNERALALVEAALAEADELPPSRRARLLRDKGQYLGNLNRPGSAQLLEQALATVPPGSLPSGDPLRPHLMTELAAQRMLAGYFDAAIETARGAIAEAQESPARMRSIAHNILAASLVESGRIDEGFAEFEIAGALAAGDAGATLRYLVNASDALNSVGRYAEAVRMAEEGVARARERGVERTSGIWLAANTAEPLIALGQYEQAGAMLRVALGFDDRTGVTAQLQRVRLWVWHGEPKRADDLLRRLRSPLRALAELEQQTRLALARASGEVAIALGEFDRAWLETRGIGAPPFCSLPGYDLPVLAVASRALAELAGATDPGRSLGVLAGGGAGSGPEASGLAATEAALAATEAALAAAVLAEARRLESVLAPLRTWPTAPAWAPLIEAELATARAAVSPAADRSERYADPAAAWEQASAAAEHPLAPAQLLPYALLRAARVAQLSGDRPRADRLVTQGRELAEAGGVAMLVRAADAIGAQPPARAAAAASAQGQPLTEREEQVLALIEQGLSNKQIGERLYISAKTASVHVSSILRKTGASSRTEAVYLASRPLT
ncbi:helix-turn-helix transcriptional regulator [Leifsonia sp. C5G2]|uniref:helix-turn-helix transcriptional regulator n=1 Tax=Leifsonia sp. C5G2 TaxID=2735269 RepID=UPI001584B519|nr:helix-turn-helix transcriptional regulator [Leifsonia sp. C5G2]NUU07481.1 AAA family ATPase [Leifsonia sp. C5G2]